MSDVINVTLSLDIDIQQWRDMGFEIADNEMDEFAKEEFMEWIYEMSHTDIYECLHISEVE